MHISRFPLVITNLILSLNIVEKEENLLIMNSLGTQDQIFKF